MPVYSIFIPAPANENIWLMKWLSYYTIALTCPFCPCRRLLCPLLPLFLFPYY